MSRKLRNLLIANTILSLLFVYPAFGLMIMFVMGGASVGSLDSPTEALINLAMYIVYAGIALPFSIVPSLIISWVFYKLNRRTLTIFFAIFHWLILLSIVAISLCFFNFVE